MLTRSRCVLHLTKPCPIVSYHLCGAPSFVWYLLQFLIYHDYYFCDPKRIVASWSRGFQVICFIPRPELLINLPRSLIDMETVTQNLLQPSHSGKRLIMSKARWGEISLAILVQNRAKYCIMWARRALSKMKKCDCTDGKQKIVKSLLKPLEKTIQSGNSTSVHGFRTSRIMLLRHFKEEQHSLPGSLFPFSR